MNLISNMAILGIHVSFRGPSKNNHLIWAKRLLFGSMGHYRFGHPHLCIYLEGQGVPGSLLSPKHGRTTILETEMIIFKCFPHTHWFWEERVFWNNKTSEHLRVRPEKKTCWLWNGWIRWSQWNFYIQESERWASKSNCCFCPGWPDVLEFGFVSPTVIENKNHSTGFCNCSYLAYLQVQVSNFQVSGRNLWFKGFQISEPWRILVLPGDRDRTDSHNWTLSFCAGGHGFGSLGLGAQHGHGSMAMATFQGLDRAWYLFFFFSECNFPKSSKMWHIHAC